MNMVGTPWRAVHRSDSTASRTVTGPHPSSGKTTVAPCVKQARTPRTIPKQWYRGHWEAESIPMSQLHAITHEKAVIDDVAVRQRSTLGKPSGPTGELDVDRIVRLQHLLQALDLSLPPRRVLPHPETDEIQESALHQGESPIRVEEASLTSAETERNDPAPEPAPGSLRRNHCS